MSVTDEGQGQLLNVADVAARLNVAPSWVYAQVESEDSDLPYLRIGRYIRFEPASISEFIATRRCGRQLDSGLDRPVERWKKRSA